MPEAVRLADRVIAVSEHTAFDLENEFPHASGKITVVPLGVAKFGDSSDLDEFPESVAKSNRPFFLFVGTHEPRKNLRRLVEAYAILPENIKELADLVVVGGKGWGDVDVDGLANEQGVSQRVKALGYVTDRQLFSLYTRALFLAMPSLYEGFGLPLVEAMSVGTPVLTSNVSSMPEVAGKAAVLVDPESVKSISDGLKKLLLEENFRITLGKIAKKQTSQISWDLTANRTLDVFKQAIAARKERRRKN
jgi:glycosyltransferase involved in cell wall biosynthesis